MLGRRRWRSYVYRLLESVTLEELEEGDDKWRCVVLVKVAVVVEERSLIEDLD